MTDFFSKPIIPPLYEHQEKSVQHFDGHPATLDASDPGTGKTRSHLESWAERRRNNGAALLVLAPKSLLESAWLADLNAYMPQEFEASIAYATNRQEAFNKTADVYITNIDAVKWLDKQRESFFKSFDEIIVDEATAYKHHTSQRSKALNRIKKYFEHRRAITGTPNSRAITDIWNQIFFLDDGQRLGDRFYAFRNIMQVPKQVGPAANMVQWTDKPDAELAVAGLISDITIRHRFEDCLDIPPNSIRSLTIKLNKKVAKAYTELKKTAILELEHADVTAVNAAVLTNKLLQVASGSVYAEGETHIIDNERYKLTLDLVEEVDHSVVFFLWRHQKEALEVEAKKRGVSYEVIDGTVPDKRRAEIAAAYQAGFFQTLFLHPKSAAHGLTFTRGIRTIWATPPYEPDLFKQGNHRIYRSGQTRKTETIVILAIGTIEQHVYDVMNDKGTRMFNLLDILRT